MKKILAAVDGSLASIRAAQKAVELSAAMQAELTLVYVSPPAITAGELPLSSMAGQREADLARGEGILKDVSSLLEAKVKTLNLMGPPAEVIADTAMDEGFEMVVVGNKGRGAVSRVLLGSVADRLVHICPRPVMVVR